MTVKSQREKETIKDNERYRYSHYLATEVISVGANNRDNKL